MSQYTGLWMPFPLPEMDFVVKITWNDLANVRGSFTCMDRDIMTAPLLTFLRPALA